MSIKYRKKWIWGLMIRRKKQLAKVADNLVVSMGGQGFWDMQV